MKEGTFELKCGETLHLREVRQTALRPILLRFGNADLFENPEKLLDLRGRAMKRAIGATEQLYNYCAGWGVTDDPPEEVVEELAEMGFEVGTARLARINWIRYLLLADDEEMGAFIAAVMALSLQPEPEEEMTESLENGD